MTKYNSFSTVYTPKVAVPVSDPDDPDYIVSPGGQYDGVVQIEDGNSTGTGALLSTGRHILTAAHVVEGMNLSDIAVAFDLTSGRQILSASQVHIHSNWNQGWGYDIAIIELAEDAPATGYEIYRGSSEIDNNFSLVGYGGKGTGNTGDVPVEEDPGLGLIKRTGDNTYEALNEDFKTIMDFGDAPDGSMLFYDFDDGTSQRDALGGLIGKINTGLGTSEVNSVGGDSGGPNFITIDGQLQIAGIVSGGNMLGADYDILEGINSSFGEVSHDTRVSYFSDWIDNIAGTSGDSTTDSSGDNNTGSSSSENNDTFIVQRGFIGKGEGDDIYVLSSNQIDKNAQITITDTQGSNSLQFIGGLSISSSIIAPDAVQLTLSNDAVVTILGASDMSYTLGGNPLSGTIGIDKNFTSFITDVLSTTVPTAGTNEGGSADINSDGSVNAVSPAGSGSMQQGAAFTGTVIEKRIYDTGNLSTGSLEVKLTGTESFLLIDTVSVWL